MQRDLEELQSENRFFENTKGSKINASSSTGGAYDDESTLVQWIDQLGTVFTCDCSVERMG